MAITVDFLKKIEECLKRSFPDWPYHIILHADGRILLGNKNRSHPFCELLHANDKSRKQCESCWSGISGKADDLFNSSMTVCPFGLVSISSRLYFPDKEHYSLVLCGVRQTGSALPDFDKIAKTNNFKTEALFSSYESVPLKRFSEISDDLKYLSTLADIISREQALPARNLEIEQLQTLRDISIFITSTLDLDKILDFISGCLGTSINTDGCFILLRDGSQATARYRLASGFGIPESFIEHIEIEEEKIEKFLAEVRQQSALSMHSGESKFLPLIIGSMPGLQSKSLLCTPVKYGDAIDGLIFLFTREYRHFTQKEIDFVLTVSNQLSGAMRNARMYAEMARKTNDLTELFEKSKTLGATLRLSTVLDNIVRYSTEVIGGKGCVLRILSDNQELQVVAHFGIDPTFTYDQTRKLGDGLAGWVAKHRESALVPDISSDPRCSKLNRHIIHSAICIPLIDKDTIIGTISVYDKLTPAGNISTFTEADLHLLSIFALHAAQSYSNAKLLSQLAERERDKDKSYNELNLIHKISVSMIGAMDLDQIMYIISTAVTAGVGIGFNRCVIMLLEKEHLVGTFGIGPATVDEVDLLWKAAQKVGNKLEDFFYSEVDMQIIKNSKFYTRVTGSRIPLLDADTVPVMNWQRGTTFAAGLSPVNRINPQFMSLMDPESMVVVPIVAKDKNIGILAVDNLYTHEKATREKVSSLETIANLAGLAIESVMLYQRLTQAHKELQDTTDKLIQRERLAAIGQMASAIAHDFKNPLASVGGYTRRLLKGGFRADYLTIILEETIRLEKMVENILDFTREYKIIKKAIQPDKLIAKCISLIPNSDHYRFDIQRSGDIPWINADEDLLIRVFINVFDNAMSVSLPEQPITIMLKGRSDRTLVIEVQDRGAGISKDALDKIFEPFYTDKQRGTGLGLAIARRILNYHGGSIAAANHPQGGAVFSIVLPIS